MMNYQTFNPPEILQPFIKHFWALEGDAAGNSEKTFSAIPDGCPGVIMVQSEKEAFCLNNNKKLPNIFLYGQTIRPATFSAVGKIGAIGICFQPHALKSIFGLDADELTNSCTDLSLIGSKSNNNLSDQLLNAATIDEQIRLLSFYLFEQYQSNDRHPDGIIKYAISQLTHSKGKMSIKELNQKVQVSERTLERKFKESVGISPQLYSRIIRFQESLNQLRKSDYDRLSDIAYDNDYADQSHFIRVFKEFTGFSPIEFKKNSDEVAENFPRLKK
ncbi:MAG TPA: AraC family transcriptional regulator [Pedobacter sp.]|uniref:AraC family transcriptional regulator n=1 Tax=Pedobacter sp. TaxID=1411316 RepID=UPI002B5EC110|nr:AraC family transcriptional regulator [Pedobacter sp.]HMI05434.1 AraC family transcriptional regulator [Pedobacter sp.]